MNPNELARTLTDFGGQKTESVAMASDMPHQCRSCRHRPKHWTRWQSDREIWFDGRCLKAKVITRPENVCGKWSGWENEEGDHGDGE